MKKFFTLFFMCLGVYQIFAAEWTNIRSADPPAKGLSGK